MKTFQQRMEQYAALAVEVGVNVQPGQKLCVIAPVAAAEFVREVVKHAYRIGRLTYTSIGATRRHPRQA